MEDVGRGVIDGREWFCHTEALDTDGPWFGEHVWHGRTLVKLMLGLAPGPGESPAAHKPYLCVEVFGSHLGVHGRPWCADCYLELSDRRQWSPKSVYATREEAAGEAAAFMFAALELLRRDQRGEAVLTPGQKREAAALKAWDENLYGKTLDDLVRLVQRRYDLRGTPGERPGDGDDSDTTERILREQLRAKKHERDEQKRSFVQRYHELRSWREFA